MEQTCRGHHTGSGRAGVILLALALALPLLCTGALAEGSAKPCRLRAAERPACHRKRNGRYGGGHQTPGRLAGYAGHGSGRRGGFRGTDRQL